MTMPTTQRNAAITVLRRIRSKAIDTERLLLLDKADTHLIIERAAQLEGQAQLLVISIMDEQINHGGAA